MKKHIPNIITLGNLTCGLLAIMSAFSDTPWYAAYFIFGGLFLDFFDGFFARILKVDGEIGKQLDSLADMVTFGVAPGILMYKMIEGLVYLNFDAIVETSLIPSYTVGFTEELNPSFGIYDYLPYLAFLIPLLSAVRLAKFNIATNQSDQFIGLPTPANAVFFSAIALIATYREVTFDFPVMEYFVSLPSIIGFIILFSLLLNANIPLIALKFKSFGWKGNEARFIFLGVALLVIFTSMLISNIFVSIPIIILLYLIISIINNYTKKAT
jgi:CDP-diacylglycerol--serine O-phosphatidyltransferase